MEIKGPIEDLKERFEDPASTFISESVVRRVARFDKAVQLLSEHGWTKSDLEWADSVLRGGVGETAFQDGPIDEKDFPHPDEVADDLEDAAESDRQGELSGKVREEARLVYALQTATAELSRIELPGGIMTE